MKPATQLIKPALREIPMPIPRKEEFLKTPDFQDRKLFTPSPSALRPIAPLQRNFEVGIQNPSAPSSLFQLRSETLHARNEPSDNLLDLSAKVSLLDVRKKFTQK